MHSCFYFQEKSSTMWNLKLVYIESLLKWRGSFINFMTSILCTIQIYLVCSCNCKWNSANLFFKITLSMVSTTIRIKMTRNKQFVGFSFFALVETVESCLVSMTMLCSRLYTSKVKCVWYELIFGNSTREGSCSCHQRILLEWLDILSDFFL